MWPNCSLTEIVLGRLFGVCQVQQCSHACGGIALDLMPPYAQVGAGCMHQPILSAQLLRDTLCVRHTRAQLQECSCMRFCMAVSLGSCRIFHPTGVWHQEPAAPLCTLKFLQVSSARPHCMYCSVLLIGNAVQLRVMRGLCCRAASACFVVRMSRAGECGSALLMPTPHGLYACRAAL